MNAQDNSLLMRGLPTLTSALLRRQPTGPRPPSRGDGGQPCRRGGIESEVRVRV